MQPLTRPSNVSQGDKLWHRNSNNITFHRDKLFAKMDYFRCEIASQNGHHPRTELIVEEDFETCKYTFELKILRISKKEYEDYWRICRTHLAIIWNNKHSARKFIADRKIKFNGKQEKGIDCGGLRVEAMEHFKNY